MCLGNVEKCKAAGGRNAERAVGGKRERVPSGYGIDLGSRSGPQNRMGLRQARAFHSECGAIHENALKELSGILNEQQLEELKRMQDERKAEVTNRTQRSEG